MATLSPDVRDSTLKSLKLTCPSAEAVTHQPPSSSTTSSPNMSQNPFVDADEEWSDEEELSPRGRRVTQYIPTRAHDLPSYNGTSSEASSRAPSPDRAIAKEPPQIPRKDSPRGGGSSASSEEELEEPRNRMSWEHHVIRKELQGKYIGPNDVPARAFVVYKSEEKTLIGELHALRHEIRRWSEEYFSGPPSHRSKAPRLHSAKDLFGPLTDDYHAYLKHHQRRALLVQAYIWSQLQQNVFSNWQKGCGYMWAGKLGDKKLRTINDTLRKAVKNETQAEDYHQWRANTVNLLVPLVDGRWQPTFDAGPVLKRISRFCSRMQRRLRPWSTVSLRHDKDDFRNIVSAAVALDLKMKRQRADYRFVTFTGEKKNQYWGYGFYESEMEDIEDDHGGQGSKTLVNETKIRRKVELALAPALERCGTISGRFFEQNTILVKADISCKRIEQPKPKAAAKRGGSTRPSIKNLSALWSNHTR